MASIILIEPSTINNASVLIASEVKIESNETTNP